MTTRRKTTSRKGIGRVMTCRRIGLTCGLLLITASVAVLSPPEAAAQIREGRSVLDRIGEAPYPCAFLGIYGSRASAADGTTGALVEDVISASGAEAAGLRRGDVIERFDGEPVAGILDLRRRIVATAPGTRVLLNVVREGRSLELSATIGNRDPDRPCEAAGIERRLSVSDATSDSLDVRLRRIQQWSARFDAGRVASRLLGRLPEGSVRMADSSAASIVGLRMRLESELMVLDSCRLAGRTTRLLSDTAFPRLFRRFEFVDGRGYGLTVRSIPRQLAEYFEVPFGETGVLVVEVAADSPAAEGRIRAGDVIIEVDTAPVATPVDLYRHLSGGAATNRFVLIRDGRVLHLEVGSKETASDWNPEDLR